MNASCSWVEYQTAVINITYHCCFEGPVYHTPRKPLRNHFDVLLRSYDIGHIGRRVKYLKKWFWRYDIAVLGTLTILRSSDLRTFANNKGDNQ